MEPTPTPDSARLDRLVADQRRISIIYGISLVSIALVVSAMVLMTPVFDILNLRQHPSIPDMHVRASAQIPMSTTTSLDQK